MTGPAGPDGSSSSGAYQAIRAASRARLRPVDGVGDDTGSSALMSDSGTQRAYASPVVTLTAHPAP